MYLQEQYRHYMFKKVNLASGSWEFDTLQLKFNPEILKGKANPSSGLPYLQI